MIRTSFNMASTSSSLALFILSLALFSISSSSCSNPSDKVPLTLYYESLCLGCSVFISKYLGDVFYAKDQGLIDIIDLKLVPYGNAYEKNGQIVCQHGPEECKLNRVEACAIHFLPDPEEHFGVIYCMETLIAEGYYKSWETCLNKVAESKNFKVIRECYGSQLGDKLHRKHGNDTDHLEPPHKYVPWVLVDNKPLFEDLGNFISYVCKAYKGKTPPKACNGTPLVIVPEEKTKPVNQVCSKEIGTPRKLQMKNGEVRI